MSTVGLEANLDRVWSWVTHRKTGIIGVYGTGGVGKTTLLKLILEKLGTTSSIVIWVTVSGDFQLGNVHDEIWRRIGSFDQKWVEKNIDEKAKCIYDRLSLNKFVLFLDDLWQPIDLKSLGVPYPDILNQSKVIFSTRSEDVCYEMDPDKSVNIQVLTDQAAWALFWMKAGHGDMLSDTKISDLAKTIAKNCSGLPILICTVASAIACRKTFEQWKFAVQELESYQNLELHDRIFSLFRFCYNSLPNDMVKYCFLYFSLFPEDFTIPKNDLIDFWISEGFFGYYDNRGSVLNLGYHVINTLITASLFEEENGSVKMLDMVRDFALSVALVESNISTKSQLIGARLELPDGEGRVGAGRISSMGKIIQNLPSTTPEFLTFLILHNPFVMMRNYWVRGKAELTVLDLSNTCIEGIPLEIFEFVSLQHLNLSNTWIEKLPVELKKLGKLKCLNLENDDQLRLIPKQVISKLSSLQVLRMFRCGFSLQEEEDNILSATNTDINELQCLQNLKVLSLTITCAFALEKFFSTDTLPSCTHALSLEVFWGSNSLNISAIAAMEHLVTLEIHQIEHLRDINFNFKMATTSFTGLREVNVEKCSNLRDLTWLILAPNLATLRVSYCPEMEEIISNRRLARAQNTEWNPFAKLEILQLENMHKLKSIYWEALPFQFLKKIKVYNCPQLKKLPLNANSAFRKEIVIEAEKYWWREVKWEDNATQLSFRNSSVQKLH